jgi:hypothetical protein
MRTIETKKTIRKAPQKSTTTGRTGKSNPLTITIDGEFAEALRAEAEGAGMMPLSLVKQRLKFGNLLTDDTEEAKQFRLEIAEQAFRDAGKPIPSAKKDTAPRECIKALVRLEDARLIASFTARGVAPLWTVASVFLEIGNEAIAGERAAEEAAGVLNVTPNHLLWRCISRDTKNFTEEIPVYLPDGEYHAETAAMMGRSLSDWVGTLIMIGAEILAARPNLSFMTDGRQFDLLAASAELSLRRESDA